MLTEEIKNSTMIAFVWIKQTSNATIVTIKIMIFVTVSNRNKKIQKKTRIDRRNFDCVDQNNFSSSYLRDINTHNRKKIDASTNHDELRCYQKFHFSLENEKTWHQWILSFECRNLKLSMILFCARIRITFC